MKNLMLYLNSIYPLSNDLQSHLSEVIKGKEVSKKTTLLKNGHICRNVIFVERGLVRCYYMKRDKEVCSWFMKEGDIIISVESFIKQTPSYESIQTVEDSLIYYLNYEELQKIYKQYVEFNFIGRVLTEKYYALCEQRLFSMRMQKAVERYQYLMNNFPDLILRLPSKYIASYLSITEETLSRTKAKIIY